MATALARLRQDYLGLKREHMRNIEAEPLPTNILEWHYVFRGPESTPYEGGYYHGKLVFPEEYPFKPPGIYMFTPNGRFKDQKICLTMSDFHPETWKPVWNVSTILLGVLSFMTDEIPSSTYYITTINEKREFALSSLEFNLKNKVMCELFPLIEIEMRMILQLELEESEEENETND